MPKAARKLYGQHNENELQEDSNLSQEASSDDEVGVTKPQFQPSTSQMQTLQ